MDVEKNCKDVIQLNKVQEVLSDYITSYLCQLFSESHHTMCNLNSLCASVLPSLSRMSTLPHFFLLKSCLHGTPFTQPFPAAPLLEIFIHILTWH